MEKLPDKYKEYIFSRGTMKNVDLMRKYTNFIDDLKKENDGMYPRYIDFKMLDLYKQAKRLVRLIELTDELEYYDEKDNWDRISIHLLDEIFDKMNGIAPEGTYFGSSLGDGTLYGFHQIQKKKEVK